MKEKNMIKISFTGDLICQLEYFYAVKKRKNQYNFNDTFIYLKEYLKHSDYVVGNLETPICNPIFGGYTIDWYSFNTPKSFLEALKNSNFKLLTTANNHCLDRGILGLKQTIKNIKKYDMEYLGTKLNNEEKDYKIIEIDGVKIAFLAYTYGTNYSYNYYKIKEKDLPKINLIKKQDSDQTWHFHKINFYKDLFGKFIIRNIKYFIKKIINYKAKPYNLEENMKVIDKINTGEWVIDETLLNDSIQKIREAINNSNITIFMLHSGGQFNEEPGSFTKMLIEKIKTTGVPLIVSNHPHVVQRQEFKNNQLVIYSLGNVINSYRANNYRKENLGEYSVILNAYINKKTKQIEKYTFSLMKSVESEDGYITVVPVYDLINKESDKNKKETLIEESLIIYNRFTEQKNTKFINEREYVI